MTSRIFLLLLLIPFGGLGQGKVINIHVTLNGAPDGTKFYLFMAFNQDSATSKNGRFDLVYHKRVSEPEPTIINTGYKDPGLMCWVEDSDMTIVGSYPDFDAISSSGSSSQKDYEKFGSFIKGGYQDLKTLRREVRRESDPTRKAAAQNRLDSVQLKLKNRIKDFIGGHPNSSVSTFILMMSASDNDLFTNEEVLKMFDRLDATQKMSEFGRQINGVLQLREQLMPQNPKPKN